MSRWTRAAQPLDCALSALLLVALCVALSGCKYLPAEPPPSSRDPGRAVLPCEIAPAGLPCQRPIVRQTICDKRFGKALCEGKKP